MSQSHTLTLNSADSLIYSHPNMHLNRTPNADEHRIVPQARLARYSKGRAGAGPGAGAGAPSASMLSPDAASAGLEREGSGHSSRSGRDAWSPELDTSRPRPCPSGSGAPSPTPSSHSIPRPQAPGPGAGIGASSSALPTPPGSPGRALSPSTSLRRKPVPSYLPMPNVNLPSSHPFATSSSSIVSGQGGGLVNGTGLRAGHDDSPGTPCEGELFFVPPVTKSGPLPPPRRHAQAQRTQREPTPPVPREEGRGVEVLHDAETGENGPADTAAPAAASTLLRRQTFSDTLDEFQRADTPRPAADDTPPSLGTPPPIPSRQASMRSHALSFEAGGEAVDAEDEARMRPLSGISPTSIDTHKTDAAAEMGLHDMLAATPITGHAASSAPFRPSSSSDSHTAPATPRTPMRSTPRLMSPESGQRTPPAPARAGSPAAPSARPSEDESKPSRLLGLKLAQATRDKDRSKATSATSASSATALAAKPGRRISLLPLGEPEEDETFSVDRVPSKRRLWEAGTCFLRDEDGGLVSFGDLFPRDPLAERGRDEKRETARGTESRWGAGEGLGNGHGNGNGHGPDGAKDGVPESASSPLPPPKTVIFFIRHFWCGQCQDYMFASLSLLDPEALERANVRVVVISNGSWKIIKAYKKLFQCPFPIYVDGPRRLYALLGMTKLTNDFGPMFKGRAAYHQRPVPTQLLHGLGNAFFRMPLADPGKLTQLGGEFVLAPGFVCEFANRMTNTSNHMEAPEVLRRAGVPHPTKSEVAQIKLEDEQRAELDRLQAEMKDWRHERQAELERIRQRKAARRGEVYDPATRSLLDLDMEDEPDLSGTAGMERGLGADGRGAAQHFERDEADRPRPGSEEAGNEYRIPDGHSYGSETMNVADGKPGRNGQSDDLYDDDDDDMDSRFEAAVKLEDRLASESESGVAEDLARPKGNGDLHVEVGGAV